MANKVTPCSIVQTKIEWIKSQRDELHGVLNSFIEKEIKAVAATTNPSNQDANKIREVNSRLDQFLDFLLEKCSEMTNYTSGSSTAKGSDIITQTSLSSGNQTASEFVQFKKDSETKFCKLEERVGRYMRLTAKNEERIVERLTDIDTAMHTLKQNTSCLSEEVNSRNTELQDLRKQMETEYIDIKSLLQTNVKDPVPLSGTTDEHTLQLEMLKSQYCHVMTSLADISSKLESTQSTVNDLAPGRIQDEHKLMELQGRIMMVEHYRSRDLDLFKEKLEEVDGLYKQVCLMVASKVKPLQHLCGILSKYHRTMELQEETAVQTSSAQADVIDQSQVAISLGPKKRRVSVGFTAAWGELTHISANTTLIFTDVLCNEGNCYDNTTGNFTAPYDGLYLTTLTLRQKCEGKIDTHVRLAKYRHFVVKRERTVCKSLTSADKASCCDTGVVAMKAGDKIFVRVMDVESKPLLSFYSSFSCILVG